MDIQRLNTIGFLFTSFKRSYNFLRADYGGGLVDTVPLPAATDRTWQIKIATLPDKIEHGLIPDTQLTRAAYLYKSFCDSKEAGDQPFLFSYADPGENPRDWLASFADDELTFEQLCDRVFGNVGLTLKQRALRDQESPGEATPEDNPDKI